MDISSTTNDGLNPESGDRSLVATAAPVEGMRVVRRCPSAPMFWSWRPICSHSNPNGHGVISV